MSTGRDHEGEGDTASMERCPHANERATIAYVLSKFIQGRATLYDLRLPIHIHDLNPHIECRKFVLVF